MSITKLTKKERNQSRIIWEGASLLTGEPIAVIATCDSKNPKTADMVQTYIIPVGDETPNDATKSGGDAAVCGDCPHRPTAGNSCYVTVFFAPNSCYRAYKRGSYTREWDADTYAGRLVRLGSYGDPAAVPFEVWERLTRNAAGVTGYTHQWASCDPRLAQLCMASCDSPADYAAATADGWRTFRVRLAHEELNKGEVVCPASAEAGHKLTCEQCGSCDGNRKARRGSIAIIAHGAPSKVVRFEAWRAA